MRIRLYFSWLAGYDLHPIRFNAHTLVIEGGFSSPRVYNNIILTRSARRLLLAALNMMCQLRSCRRSLFDVTDLIQFVILIQTSSSAHIHISPCD